MGQEIARSFDNIALRQARIFPDGPDHSLAELLGHFSDALIEAPGGGHLRTPTNAPVVSSR